MPRSGAPPGADRRDPIAEALLVYDPKQDDAEAEDLWLDLVQRIAHWPTVAPTAVAWEAWLDLNLIPGCPGSG